MRSKRTHKGFTLIELVFVIVILGILAAFAVPRFVDLTSEARSASVEGLAGSVRSAAALAHAQALADDLAAGSDITVENETISMNNNDYPIADTAANDGVEAMLQDTTGFQSAVDTDTLLIWPDDLTQAAAADPIDGTGAGCGVSYTLTATDEAPTIEQGTDAC